MTPEDKSKPNTDPINWKVSRNDKQDGIEVITYYPDTAPTLKEYLEWMRTKKK